MHNTAGAACYLCYPIEPDDALTGPNAISASATAGPLLEPNPLMRLRAMYFLRLSSKTCQQCYMLSGYHSQLCPFPARLSLCEGFMLSTLFE